MHAIQPGQRVRFVVRHLKPRHPQGETVDEATDRANRRELFSSALRFAHLPEVVVRVVVVVVRM